MSEGQGASVMLFIDITLSPLFLICLFLFLLHFVLSFFKASGAFSSFSRGIG